MDFFRALLEPRFSETYDGDASTSAAHPTERLYPRIPALFEPIAPRVDVAPFEETVEANESRRDEIPARLAPSIPSQEMPRPREPYRGIMDVPPTRQGADASTAAPTPNNAPRDVYAPAENANKAPMPRAEPGTRAQSEMRVVVQDIERFHETRGETQTKLPFLRPQISESRLPEARAETDPNAQAQTAPVVRINIGRIIVRASVERSPQRSAPRSPARESKKMSLDEYLKKHGRGDH
jgi:hypothetical protein